MNAKTAICASLLRGEVLSIKSAFNLFGITNLPREVSRQIEQPFNVKVSRTRRDGKSRYGQPCTWFEYRLNRTEYNRDGIDKMKQYVKAQIEKNPPKTQSQLKALYF